MDKSGIAKTSKAGVTAIDWAIGGLGKSEAILVEKARLARVCSAYLMTTDRMPPSLLGLGRDIFVMHILPQLDAKDVNSLRQTCKELDTLAKDPAVWHAIYNAMFPPPEAMPPIRQEGWEERCNDRCSSRVYAWGSAEAGRIGVALSDVDRDHRGRRGVNRPWPVQAFSDVVVRNIGCGGYFTAILSTHGEIQVAGDFHGQLRGVSPPMRLKASNAKFTAMSCGRTFLLGRDSTDNIYMWLHTRESDGVLLDLGGLQVQKMVAGWSAAAVITDEVGVAVWKVPEVATETFKVNYLVVPHTGGGEKGAGDWRVVDVAVGASFIAITTQNGKLFTTKLDFEAVTLPAPEYNADIHAAVNGEGITKVYTLLNRLVAVTANGHIVQTQWEDGRFTRVELLDLDDVVQVAVGDHHCLALTTNGSIYAWGTEPHSCGAFGMGTPAQIGAAGGETRPIRWFASDSTLAKPTRVHAPPMYRIAAGGWHSAAVGNRKCGGQD